MTSTTTKPTFYTLPGGGRLRGDAAASYLRMRAAGMPAGGVDVYSRTMAQQAELRRRYEAGIGPLAARPTPTAPHIRGVAMDLQTTRGGIYNPSSAHLWLSKGGKGQLPPQPGERLQCHPFGWRRTARPERWHYAYDPAKDTKAKADLSSRLKTLQYKDVKAFQKAAGLTPDGVAGPQTWTALLSAKPGPPKPPEPKPAPTPKPPTEQLFRFGQANLQAERFGGEPDNLPVRGEFLASMMACSIYALAEVTETARDSIRAAVNGGSARWRTYPQGMVAVLFDNTKWSPDGRGSVRFGPRDNGIHGAVRAQLINKASAQKLDVIAVHVRPAAAIGGDAATVRAGKLTDVRQALTLVRKGVPTLLAGDWNTAGAEATILAAGFTRATPALDSLDTPGSDPIDATYTRGVGIRGATQIDPGGLSDHKVWVVNCTLPSSTL